MKTTNVLIGTGLLAVGLISLLNGQQLNTPAPNEVVENSFSYLGSDLMDPEYNEAIEMLPAIKWEDVTKSGITPEGDLQLEEVVYLEDEQIDLGFDVDEYLPADFESDPLALTYIESEEALNLDFNTEKYLPEDFNPYKPYYFSIDTINYMEEENIELDFDTAEFLPANFDPYAKKDWVLAQHLEVGELCSYFHF